MNRLHIKKIIEHNLPFFCGIPAVVWQIIFFYIPVLCILLMSVHTFSGEFFLPFFSSVYVAVFLRSLALATSTVVLCLLFGYPVAYWLALRAGSWKNIFMTLLFIPFWTNFLLHVYAWMFVLDRQGVVNTVLEWLGIINAPMHILHTYPAMQLLMVYCYMPFMILPIYSSLEKFDQRFEEASLDLGATWWQTLWNVVIPLSMPGIQSGFFLVFVPAFGEFVIPELVGGDKVLYVGGVISYLAFHVETAPYGAAFTLLASFILIMILWALYTLFRRVDRQSIPDDETVEVSDV